MIDLKVLEDDEMITLVSFRRDNYYMVEAHTRLTVDPELYRDHFFPLSPWLRSIQDLLVRQMEERIWRR